MLFPGLGYSAHMPLIYYAGRLLTAHGADVLRVEYAYANKPDFTGAPEAEQGRWLQSDATAAYEAALRQGSYQQVTLVGKSLGTLALGHLLATQRFDPTSQCVWLTPLLFGPLVSQIKQTPHRALFVNGTADSYYLPKVLADVRRAIGGESIVIRGANHSLEIPGDVARSIRALAAVMRKMQAFLA